MAKKLERLGERLKRLRERAGLTQSALARRVDCSVVTIANVEQGRTTDPGWRLMEAIARELGAGLEEFAGTAPE